MGYTAVGRVQAVGSKVKGFAKGDRVICGGSHATHWLVIPSKVSEMVGAFRDYMIEKIPDNLVDDRLAMAQELGATHIIDAGKEDVVATIRALTEIPGVGGAHWPTSNRAAAQRYAAKKSVTS